MRIIRKFGIVTLMLIVVLVSCGSGSPEESRENASQQSSADAESEMDNEGNASTSGDSGESSSGDQASTVANSSDNAAPSTSEAREQALNFQQVFRDVAAQVSRVVVEVNVVDVVEMQRPQSPFDFFFSPDRDEGQDDRQYRRQGLGSGGIVGFSLQTPPSQ